MKAILIVGPPIVFRVMPDKQNGDRRFMIMARDQSCNVTIDVDEPWMSDDAIGRRLTGREGTEVLIQSVTGWLRAGGKIGRS